MPTESPKKPVGTVEVPVWLIVTGVVCSLTLIGIIAYISFARDTAQSKTGQNRSAVREDSDALVKKVDGKSESNREALERIFKSLPRQTGGSADLTTVDLKAQLDRLESSESDFPQCRGVECRADRICRIQLDYSRVNRPNASSTSIARKQVFQWRGEMIAYAVSPTEQVIYLLFDNYRFDGHDVVSSN